MSERSFAFALRGKWVLGHVLAVVAIVVFIAAGFWQLRRLADRQEFNSLLTSRATVGAESLEEVLAAYDVDDLELRHVVAVGTYRVGEEVILNARSFNGLSGHHVLTPLYLDDGRALIVDRGWVGIDLDRPGQPVSAPPEGRVTVSGAIRLTEARGSFGPVDAATGVLDKISRVDLPRLDEQVEADLLGVYVQLLAQEPAQPAGTPAIVDLPLPSEGPHRGYAVQWFLFAGVVIVGYPILLWRTATTSRAQSS